MQEATSRCNEFVYERLNTTAQEIRILVMYPSDDPASDIYCELIPVDLALFSKLGIERYPFMALSYVWGDLSPPEKIFLQGKRKEVTPNLFAALRRLRDRCLPSLLWVDSLCIDQGNIEEKNHQIGLMSLIYAKAGRVLMWLGEEANDSGLAMRLLFFLDFELSQHDYKLSPDDEHFFIKLLLSGTLDTVNNTALGHFLGRSYWSRVWIVQEVVLAKDATLCCGQWGINFKVILALYELIGFIPDLTNMFVPNKNKIQIGQLGKAFGIFAHESPMKLLDIFLLGRSRSASNKLDYIYGFLGLVNLKKEILTPNYNKSLLSVSKDVFNSIIQQDGDIDVLSLCRGLSEGTSYERFEQLDRLGWPSWLPDWTRKFIFAGQRMESIILNEAGQQCYKAAGQSQPKLNIIDDGLVLAIDGYLFDNVVSTTNWNGSVTENWKMFSQLPKDGTSFESIDARQSAFAQMIFLGQFGNGDIYAKAEKLIGPSFNEFANHQAESEGRTKETCNENSKTAIEEADEADEADRASEYNTSPQSRMTTSQEDTYCYFLRSEGNKLIVAESKDKGSEGKQ